MGELRNAYNILAGKSEGKRPLRRPTHKWENNVTDLREMGGKVWNECIWFITGISGGPM
jgi:hypothetical protein